MQTEINRVVSCEGCTIFNLNTRSSKEFEYGGVRACMCLIIYPFHVPVVARSLSLREPYHACGLGVWAVVHAWVDC